MYLSIIFIPLITSLLAGIFGRKLGAQGSMFITTFGLIITCVLSLIAMYEVGLSQSPVSIDIATWVDSEYFLVPWGFTFDSLSTAMLIPITFISSLVHMYSISYMGSDAHTQRFFSYLSAFTFSMLLLVLGDNLLVLFVGWEGEIICLKWCYIENPIFLYSQLPIIGKTIDKNLNNHSNNNIAPFKIGPHNIDVISIIIGSIGKRNFSSLNNNKPFNSQKGLLTTSVIVYSNAETDKKIILSDNKGKAGIYLWTHSSGKKYVGSSFDLAKRLKKYYTPSDLKRMQNYISNALICNTYSEFSLSILEYINITDLSLKDYRNIILAREQFYIDTLKPEYNILPTAGSRLGSSQSEKTKALISKAHIGKTHTEETIAKLREINKGENHPMYGKNHTAEAKAKMSAALSGEKHPMFGRLGEESPVKKSVFIYSFDLKTKETILYKSFNTCIDAAKFFDCTPRTISSYLDKNKLFKKRWVLRSLSKAEQENLNLSPELKETIIGLSLGDLFIEKNSPTRNTALRFEQGKIHEMYILHLYELFEKYCRSKPQYSDRKLDSRTNKIYSRIQFQTRSLPCFNEFHSMFYNTEGKKKIIPYNISELLTARGLAYWAQDDGYKAGSGFRLSSLSFTKEENLLLIGTLKNKFNLNCSLHSRNDGKNQYIIYIKKDSMVNFISIVAPYFHDSMKYKLGELLKIKINFDLKKPWL